MQKIKSEEKYIHISIIYTIRCPHVVMLCLVAISAHLSIITVCMTIYIQLCVSFERIYDYMFYYWGAIIDE